MSFLESTKIKSVDKPNNFFNFHDTPAPFVALYSPALDTFLLLRVLIVHVLLFWGPAIEKLQKQHKKDMIDRDSQAHSAYPANITMRDSLVYACCTGSRVYCGR